MIHRKTVNDVGYGDDEFLYANNSNHVSICSGLSAILYASFFLQLSPTCAELPYRMMALIVAFDITASP